MAMREARARLTRAQQQERTRAAVLAAGQEEFAERGYGEAKVDRIAERAGLTRGAVYSNFPSKRALYLAVLIDAVERAAVPAAEPPPDLGEAAGAFARAWLERLPLTGDTPAGGHLRLRSISGVFDDEPGLGVLGELARLEALLLACMLETFAPRRRRVRMAELLLVQLAGAGHLAETAPGFGDPFDVARACQHLAGLDLDDAWNPAHLPYIAAAQQVREPWVPPRAPLDLVTGEPLGLAGDGVIAVLGAGRLGAAEEALRATGTFDDVTVVVVTGDPAEIGRLVRLRIGDLATCLHRSFGRAARPRLRVVLDEAVAAAIGVPVADDTEAAVRIRAGEIVARAEGRGAAHAAAAADAQSRRPR